MLRKLFCLIAALVILPALTAKAAAELSSFSVFATNSVWLYQGSDVNSGNIGVKDSSPGPWLDSQSEVTVGTNVYVADGVSIYGDSIKVKAGASAFDVYYNELTNNGTIRGNEYTPLDLPLDITMPAFPTPTPGTEDHDIPQGGSLTLDPGSYGEIMVRKNATLTLTGGTYHFENLDLGDLNAKVLFQTPTDLIINNRLGPGQSAVIGPEDGSGISAKDIRIYVNGINGGTGNLGATPKAAQIGYTNTLQANIYAPNGTVLIKQGTVAEGAYIGKDVKIGKNVQVTLNNGFEGPGPDNDLDGDGFTENQGDCDDNDAAINPNAEEVCDDVDNNCDGQIDESLKITFYEDSDGDSYGNPDSTTEACDQPSGYVTDTTDCNDNDGSVNPGATETPYNGKDDDCDPATLDDDLDNDGYGIATDCNDNDDSIYQGATETPYDGIDQDCDGSDLVDVDGDGHVAEQAGGNDCDDSDAAVNPGVTEAPYNGKDDDCNPATLDDDLDGDGYVNADDCNDNNSSIHPGATETPYDGIDQDCDGSDLVDVDGDGYAAEQAGGDDCNDNNPNIHSGAADIPDNGIDEDCDGSDAVTVPDIVGMDQTTAESTITAANLVVGSVTTANSDTTLYGDVISQNPAGGALAPEGSSVDLVVSSGPQLSSLEVFPATLTLTAQAETHQLLVTGVYSDGSKKDLTSSTEGTTYSTDDVNIADVTSEGLTTANNNGSATIAISNNAITTQFGVTVNIQTSPPYDPTAYISGRALDYNTGQPIVGADVEELTLGTIVNTDAEGKFIYPVPQGGKYILFIEKPGYVTAKKEAVADSGKNTSVGDEFLTLYETYTTHIDAAAGGTATNVAGTIEMIFPPGALPYDIDISATRLVKDGYPVPLLKGQEFVDSVQFEPEHIDFNQDVTVRFSNIWGFSP
ncbi:MAG: PASTA domain-containing protein, partial [Planctomycetes bacterium]|nr:PASTA domain-containing protein [Planctomycetota bacterium]